MDQFLLLNQNKHLALKEVDWLTTFDILKPDNPLQTSFSSSNYKSKRIKNFIFQLPTTQRMKQIRPDLYFRWKCPTCSDA
jgi:hypothetical protein